MRGGGRGADEALENLEMVPGNYAGSALEASMATVYLPDLRMSNVHLLLESDRRQGGDRANTGPGSCCCVTLKNVKLSEKT